MATRARLPLFIAALAFVACGPVPANDKVDGWALTRGALTSGSECFAGRAEYCITDPGFVDAAIRPRLDDLYDGQMPMKRLKVEGTIRAVSRNYRRALMLPSNLARVEELVKERYENPKVTVEDDEVTLDMGVVPGHLDASAATLSLRMTSSSDIEDGMWAEREARRVLTTAAREHPDKARISAIVLLPVRRGLDRFAYHYLQGDRRVIVQRSDGETWSSRRFDGGAEGLATLPLRSDDLSQCRPAPPSEAIGHELDVCPMIQVASSL